MEMFPPLLPVLNSPLRDSGIMRKNEKPKDNMVEVFQKLRNSGPMVKDSKEFKKIYREQLAEHYKKFK